MVEIKAVDVGRNFWHITEKWRLFFRPSGTNGLLFSISQLCSPWVVYQTAFLYVLAEMTLYCRFTWFLAPMISEADKCSFLCCPSSDGFLLDWQLLWLGRMGYSCLCLEQVIVYPHTKHLNFVLRDEKCLYLRRRKEG